MNLPYPVMHPLLRAWPVTARDALPLALWSAAELAALGNSFCAFV